MKSKERTVLGIQVGAGVGAAVVGKAVPTSKTVLKMRNNSLEKPQTSREKHTLPVSVI